MSTAPRAVTSETEELAATISALKSRLNELETASGSGGTPIGTMVDFIGTTAPIGWTILDGGTITNGRILYPNLWAVLPASFKSGNNIIKPDTRGRVLVHRSTAGTLNVNVGSVGGVETVTLDATQMPNHAHDMNSHTHAMAHTHTYDRATGNTQFYNGGIGPAVGSITQTSTVSGPAVTSPSTSPVRTQGPSTANTLTAGGTGGVTQAHQNLQPYMVTVKIMKLR